MANYATNIFHASTENKQDLNKIEAFLDDNFNGFVNRYGDTVDAEFDSRWEYPEKAINELIALLAAKDKIYIRRNTEGGVRLGQNSGKLDRFSEEWCRKYA